MKNLFLISLLLPITISCSYKEPITFLRLQEVKVKGIEKGNLLLSTQAVFNNPNNVKGKLKKVDISVVHRGDTVATIAQIEKLKIPANSQFYVLISMKISINKLQRGLLSNLANLISKRTVKLEFKGSIKVSSCGVNQKVPVNYSEKIKF